MPAWLAALLTRKMLICIFTGFSSGLPLYLLLNLLPAWLRSEGIDLKIIGFFALIQFPYTWKFLWSPLLDRFSIRGWMLVTQIGLLITIGSLGGFDPKESIWPILWLAGLLALLSGTQDIAVDAFRREILNDNELGLGNAVHVNAYRIAGLIPGSMSLILADRLPWNEVFWITGAFMIPGMVMAWLVSEPQIRGTPKTLRQAVTEPFHEFIGRQGWRGAMMVLGFIFLYKLGDSLCTALATPFYLDMGFTKTDIGLIWLFGVVQLVSIFGFAWLSTHGHYVSIGAGERLALAFVIGLEALGVGLGTAAFVAFIARSTHPAYTATQMALFTSLAAVPRTFINASAGWLVETLGWTNFYGLCVALAVPGMLLLLKVAPWNVTDSTMSLQHR